MLQNRENCIRNAWLSATVPCEDCRLLNDFPDSDMKFWLKIVSVHVISPQVVWVKSWREFPKLSVKTDKVPFMRSL